MISLQRFLMIRLRNKPPTIWHKRSTPLMLLSIVLVCIITFSFSMVFVFVKYGFDVVEMCVKINMSGLNMYKADYLLSMVITLILFLIGTNIQIYLPS